MSLLDRTEKISDQHLNVQALPGWLLPLQRGQSGATMSSQPKKIPPAVCSACRSYRSELTMIDPEEWTTDEMRRWLRAVCVHYLRFIPWLSCNAWTKTTSAKIHRSEGFCQATKQLERNCSKESRPICGYRANPASQRRSHDLRYVVLSVQIRLDIGVQSLQSFELR